MSRDRVRLSSLFGEATEELREEILEGIDDKYQNNY